MATAEYWRTDLTTNLIDDIDHSALLSNFVLKDDRKWKWLVMSMHCAIQSACVCALRGAHSSIFSILSSDSQKIYSAWLNGEKDAFTKRTLHLASFPALYERVCNPLTLPAPHTLPKTEVHTRDIEILNGTLRNSFQHFSNDSLSVEKSGLPRIMRSACEVVEHLALEHLTMNFRITNEQRSSLVESLKTVRQNMLVLAGETSSSSNA